MPSIIHLTSGLRPEEASPRLADTWRYRSDEFCLRHKFVHVQESVETPADPLRIGAVCAEHMTPLGFHDFIVFCHKFASEICTCD